MRKAKLFSRKDNSFLRMAGWMMTLLFCTCLGMANLQAQNEAKIGTVEYPTLEEAIAAATSGDVVEIIVANCGIVNTTPIPAGITIKGQGKTATTMLIESTSGSGLTLSNANVTLKEMTIDGSQITSGGYKTLVNVRADGCLITDVVMTGGGSSTWNSSILVETLPSTATFTVSNSTISGSFRGVLRESCSANIVINNCDIDAVYPFNIDGGSGGTITVTGGALHGWTSYSGVDEVTFTNVTFSKANSGYDAIAAYVNTTFNECTMDANFDIYAQTTGFGFTLNDCEKNGVLVTNQNFTELFPNDPDVWNKCVTTVNEIILVGSKAQLDAAAASGPATVNTQMTQSFAYDGNLSPAITTLSVKGGGAGNNTITFSNCTATNGVLSASGDLASFTCGGAAINFDGVDVVLGENASFTVTGQTNIFKAVPLYKVNEANNGDGTYTYSTEYIGVARIGTTPYATLDAAAAAVPVGTPTTITILQNLNFYDIASSNLTNKTITFTGTPTDTLTLTDLSHIQVSAGGGSDLTFESITLKHDPTADNYQAITEVSKITCNDCEILGYTTGYAGTVICNNCTFTQTTGKYHLWTYGSNCTFNHCTFNTTYNNGKAVNVYKEDGLSQPFRVVTFNDCSFNAPTNPGSDRSAIQINSALCCFVVNVNNCTVSGYANASSSAVAGYENLINNKSTSVATTLFVNGVQLLNQGGCDDVAYIGNIYYSSLQAAVDYATANMSGDVTINLAKDDTEWVLIVQKAGLNLTIDGNNHTLTGQIIIDGEARACGTETLDITNLNFAYDANAFAIYTNSTTLTNGFIVTPTNKGPADAPYKTTRSYIYSHNITVSNCHFDGTGSTNLYAFKGAWGSNPRNIKLENDTAKNVFGFAFFAGVSHCDAIGTTGIQIEGCEAVENIQQALYISGGGSSTHNFTNNKFTAQDFAVYIDNAVNSPTYNFSGNTLEADTVFKLKLNDNGAGGVVASTTEINITDGTYVGMIKDYDPTTHLNISGGTYSEDVTGEPCAPGYAAFVNGTTPETWTVTKAWFLYYDKNEAGASGTMDTVFVKQSDPDAGRTVEVAPCAFTWLPDHSFLAWNNQADGLGDTLHPGDNITLSSDTTLYVIWQEGNTVFYNNNGGVGSIPNQYKAVDETIILSDGTDGAGNYLITKTDSTLYRWNTAADEGGDNYALGAEYSANANATMYAVWRLNLDMTMDSTDVVCYGENNGTDTVKIIGGEAPFQLVLSSTVMAENDTVKNLMDRTYIFTNLKPGSYNVQLTDVLTKDTIRGHFTIAQPDTLIVESMTVPVKPCPLMGTGVYNVSMTTTGGNGGNHFTWGEAADNVDAMASTVDPGADDRDSTYTVAVKVTDKKGCVATDTTTFAVSPVIADDGTVHANSKLTIDTIRQGIMRGCDTVLRQFGTPHFTSTNPAITEDILDTIYNNIPTAYPDSVFYLGENKVIWTATDTCGHSITGEQVIIIYHYPCPNVSDVDGNDYPSVRLGCDCWMAENLKTTKFSDGRAISNLMKYESPTHPDAEANFAIYGYLYDWTAALDAEGGVTPDAEGNVQGVCPTGWHMPTDLDFANVAGVHGRHDIADIRSTDYWLDGGGNNSTNFNLLPGGCYNDNTARYENILGEAYLWSVNSANPSQPKVFWADCHCYMWQVGDPSANMGCSVRCVKD